MAKFLATYNVSGSFIEIIDAVDLNEARRQAEDCCDNATFCPTLDDVHDMTFRIETLKSETENILSELS